MVVCIAEKPSVGKDIARILGATAQHDGYMEGNGYQVTWTFGHLCELKMPEDYTPMWRAWALSSLPMIPPRFGIRLKEDQGVKKQFAIIERLMQKADGIINCGDAGQEGELIQRWVMQKAQPTCPVKRLWISSMTDEAIREGFANLKDQSEYQSLYMAGLSRAVGDWLLGINCTRLYTIKYGQSRQVLSIGRVQTPTLALIVNRQKEIDNFKPEPYWVLATIYRDTTFTATKGKFTTKEEGEQAFQSIAGRPFTITDVQKKNGRETPPPLYDLTSLQVDCNRKFGYSAELTLNLIQQLYEMKLTTYPRVDTTFLSDDVYPKCPQIMNGLYQTRFAAVAPYAELVRPLGGKPLPKSKKVFDSSKVTDHHAIIPTGVPPQGLSDMQQRVYDLIARRFIAVFYPDCKYAQTTVMGEAAPSNLQAPSNLPPKGEATEVSSVAEIASPFGGRLEGTVSPFGGRLEGAYTIEHPGAPLNSSGDDFGMTFEGLHNRGFFSSNRGDARGWDHIYSFEKHEVVQTVKGYVYEQDGYELPEALVYMVGNDGTNLKLSVKGDGSFTEQIQPGVDYVFLGTCKGFLNHKEQLKADTVMESEEYVLQFPLASITAPVLIDNIFYDFDKATLRPESTEALDQLVGLLNENPNVTIELSAHCDYRGPAAYNKVLSQRRAESVVAYLIEHGIASDRLTPVGYGKEKPKTVKRRLTEKYPWLKEGDVLTEEYVKAIKDEEQQEVCNQLNRRTEFIVLRTTYGMFDRGSQTKPGADNPEEGEEPLVNK